DKRRFGFAAGRDAQLLDLATGKELGSWKIPPGYHDHLVFDTPDRLLLFRMETAEGKEYPRHRLNWQKHPRGFRVRELIVGKPSRVIHTIPEFNRHVETSAVAPDGSYFLVDGIRGDAKGRLHRALHRYETADGKKSWSLEWPEGSESGYGLRSIDPT